MPYTDDFRAAVAAYEEQLRQYSLRHRPAGEGSPELPPETPPAEERPPEAVPAAAPAATGTPVSPNGDRPDDVRPDGVRPDENAAPIGRAPLSEEPPAVPAAVLPRFLPEDADDGQEMSTGYLQIFATTARQAEPVPGVHVTISRMAPEGETLVATALTGRDGLSPVLSLPAVGSRYSQTPEATAPYTLYRVLLTAEGFYSQLLTGVALYGGETTLQSAAMIPLPEGMDEGLTVIDATVPDL